MNYYYPYMGYYPYASIPQKAGLFSSLFKGGGLSSIISGTQKTLGVINQAIPVIKQVKPVMNNAKTMFKVMNEFKKADTPKQNKKTVQKVQSNNVDNTANTNIQNQSVDTLAYDKNDGPTFFI